MGPFGSGLHDEVARAHLRTLEERGRKGRLASEARESRREGSQEGERGRASVRLAEALRAVADRLDRPAAECR